jgi:hypothetical protein
MNHMEDGTIPTWKLPVQLLSNCKKSPASPNRVLEILFFRKYKEKYL